MLGYDHFLTRLDYSSLFNLGEPSHSLSLKGYCQKRQVTYSLINSVLLLKTPGGSSFIWLLPKSLRKDIP